MWSLLLLVSVAAACCWWLLPLQVKIEVTNYRPSDLQNETHRIELKNNGLGALYVRGDANELSDFQILDRWRDGTEDVSEYGYEELDWIKIAPGSMFHVEFMKPEGGDSRSISFEVSDWRNRSSVVSLELDMTNDHW